MNLSLPGERPERYTGAQFTGNMFSLLRVPAVLGRTITEADAEPGAPPVVVVGYDVWQERYDGARDVVGDLGDGQRSNADDHRGHARGIRVSLQPGSVDSVH